MDIYEATQTILTEAVPENVNVSAYVLTYDAELDKYLLPDFPAVTYNYFGIVPIVSMDGSADLFRVTLDVEVWGDLEQIAANAKKVIDAINAKRVSVGNVEFSIVMIDSRDITELGLDFKRRYMRFTGLAEIGEEHGQTSL